MAKRIQEGREYLTREPSTHPNKVIVFKYERGKVHYEFTYGGIPKEKHKVPVSEFERLFQVPKVVAREKSRGTKKAAKKTLPHGSEVSTVRGRSMASGAEIPRETSKRSKRR